jgi:hypothetical protein
VSLRRRGAANRNVLRPASRCCTSRLPAFTITLIYAAYAIGAVATLFLAGHTSDWYGRRRLLLGAIAPAVVSALVFLFWRAESGLFVARIFSGLAVHRGDVRVNLNTRHLISGFVHVLVEGDQTWLVGLDEFNETRHARALAVESPGLESIRWR